jgi:hypothetical protein
MKEVFTRIPDNARVSMRNEKEQIQIIVQTLENYNKEIKELKEKINPNYSSKISS